MGNNAYDLNDKYRNCKLSAQRQGNGYGSFVHDGDVWV